MKPKDRRNNRALYPVGAGTLLRAKEHDDAPLYHHIPDAERRRFAKALFDYLAGVPILQ